VRHVLEELDTGSAFVFHPAEQVPGGLVAAPVHPGIEDGLADPVALEASERRLTPLGHGNEAVTAL
jgi:hypothetical protein